MAVRAAFWSVSQRPVGKRDCLRKPKKSRQKKYTIRLTELYLKLRAKQIDLAEWQEKVRECVEELAVMDRKSIVPKLFLHS